MTRPETRGYRSKSKAEIAEMYAALDSGVPIEKVEKKFGVKRRTLEGWRRQDRKAAAAAAAAAQHLAGEGGAVKTRKEHVIWDQRAAPPDLTLAPEEQLVLRCLNCGDRYVFALPASLSMVSAVCKVYGKEHRGCKPRAPVP